MPSVIYQTAQPATPPENTTVAVTSTTAGVAQNVVSINNLVPHEYDYISLSYTGSNLTGAVFKLGGAGGTTKATLVLTYDGSNNLLTVTKT